MRLMKDSLYRIKFITNYAYKRYYFMHTKKISMTVLKSAFCPFEEDFRCYYNLFTLSIDSVYQAVEVRFMNNILFVYQIGK